VDSSQRRELNKGLDDGITKAFELVLTPAIFGVLGYLLDRWLGTGLVFTLVLGIGVFLYECWRLACSYMAEMDKQDEGKPWARRAGGSHA
jgi:hypothetical protein